LFPSVKEKLKNIRIVDEAIYSIDCRNFWRRFRLRNCPKPLALGLTGFWMQVGGWRPYILIGKCHIE
jgi:hypothetical protein